MSVKFLLFRGGGWGGGGSADFIFMGARIFLNKNKSCRLLDGQNRQSPIASDFGSRTQIAALFAILLYWDVSNESPIARFESQFRIAGTPAIRIARF